jgi:hypothetical protein
MFRDTPAWKDLSHWVRGPPDPYDDPFRDDVWGVGGGVSEGSDHSERREVGGRGDLWGERVGGARLEGEGGDRERGQEAQEAVLDVGRGGVVGGLGGVGGLRGGGEKGGGAWQRIEGLKQRLKGGGDLLADLGGGGGRKMSGFKSYKERCVCVCVVCVDSVFKV